MLDEVVHKMQMSTWSILEKSPTSSLPMKLSQKNASMHVVYELLKLHEVTSSISLTCTLPHSSVLVRYVWFLDQRHDITEDSPRNTNLSFWQNPKSQIFFPNIPYEEFLTTLISKKKESTKTDRLNFLMISLSWCSYISLVLRSTTRVKTQKQKHELFPPFSLELPKGNLRWKVSKLAIII